LVILTKTTRKTGNLLIKKLNFKEIIDAKYIKYSIKMQEIKVKSLNISN